MKAVRPVRITDANLTSSSIPEDDYPVWDGSTSYAAAAKVIRDHRVWESAAEANTGHDPLTTSGSWIEIGATNRWAMFDEAVGSASMANGPIEVVLAPGRIDTLAVLDLVAAKVTVVVTVSGAEVYRREQTTSVGGQAIDNWYDWFFAPIEKRTRLLFDDVAAFRNGVVTVLIEGTSPDTPVACGTLLVGRMLDIGTTLSGVDIGINDYSKKSRDAFGVVTVVPRAYSDANSYQVAIPSARVDAIKTQLADLRATATLWIGEDGLDVLLTYGFYSRFRINLVLLTGMSTCAIEVESLV